MGSYGVRLRSGIISILGATLRPCTFTYWVHAPRSHALPVLECVKEARIDILPHPSSKSLKNLEMCEPIFRDLWNPHTEKGKFSTFYLIKMSTDLPSKLYLQELAPPCEWMAKLQGLEGIAMTTIPKPEQTFSVLICGPKSSGKSTFCKMLVNRLVTMTGSRGVALLDTDPGQPEYTPPGLVSLLQVQKPNFSPAFTHATGDGTDALRSHAIGWISPDRDVDHYLACLKDLIATYRARCPHLPLVVNTAGWILGSGLEILKILTQEIAPRQVVFMSTTGPVEPIDALEPTCRQVSATFTRLPSQPGDYIWRTAAHLRTMATMSYFHARPVSDTPLTWDPSPVADRQPLMALYATDSNIGIRGLFTYFFRPAPVLVRDLINGRTVALVELDADYPLPAILKTPEDLPFVNTDQPIDPTRSNALGIALVQDIDNENKVMRLITPIPLARIVTTVKSGKSLALVDGFETPTWFYVEKIYASSQEANNRDKKVDIIQVFDGDTSDESSVDSNETSDNDLEPANLPYVEVHRGHGKRGLGSKVWRVRRDLGRSKVER